MFVDVFDTSLQDVRGGVDLVLAGDAVCKRADIRAAVERAGFNDDGGRGVGYGVGLIWLYQAATIFCFPSLWRRIRIAGAGGNGLAEFRWSAPTRRRSLKWWATAR
ncbi:MAG: hypothetical protein U0231_14575 [Nitrospiraceae bacterium]